MTDREKLEKARDLMYEVPNDRPNNCLGTAKDYLDRAISELPKPKRFEVEGTVWRYGEQRTYIQDTSNRFSLRVISDRHEAEDLCALLNKGHEAVSDGES